MPLIDLKTDLKSLKFGNDRPNNGSSKQPFVQAEIPALDAAVTAVTGMTVGNDWFFRGGLLRVGAALDDTERMLKLYGQTTTGLAFNAKQVALGLLAEPTQIWNPLTIPLQVAANGVGFGHLPAFINPSLKSVFPDEVKNNGLENSKGKDGSTREDFFGIGTPGLGTNPTFKGKLIGGLNGTNVVRNRKNYNLVYDKKQGKTQLTGTADQMTLFPMYNSNNGPLPSAPKDFIKFYIAAVNNDDPTQKTYIHFRAYINGFSDSHSSSWSEVNYVGNGSPFYTYGGGYKRSVSVNFDVFCQSKQEQYMMYAKLNNLASLLAPDYNKGGFMRGTLIYLTIGDYLNNVPGFFSGITLTPPENSPWEIARLDNGEIDPSVKQLPHMISVTGFQFTPVESFLPRRIDPVTFDKDNFDTATAFDPNQPGFGRYKEAPITTFIDYTTPSNQSTQ